jgi:hypothetical protein
VESPDGPHFEPPTARAKPSGLICNSLLAEAGGSTADGSKRLQPVIATAQRPPDRIASRTPAVITATSRLLRNHRIVEPRNLPRVVVLDVQRQ